MGTVAVIGEVALVRGYVLAGATVVPAEGSDAVLLAWRSLAENTALVILTPAAAGSLGAELAGGVPMSVVMPT